MSEEQVDPDVVKAKIQEILANKNGGEGEQVPLNLDPAVVDRLNQRSAARAGIPVELPEEHKSEEEGLPNPDRGRESTTFSGATPDTSGIKSWALQTPTLKKEHVEPTDMDKMLYLKAMLNEEPVEFNIPLPALNTSIGIRSLNNYEQDVIFRALELDQKDEEIVGPAQYVARIQYYSAALQITTFNKKQQDYVTFIKQNGKFPPTAESADKLREFTREFIGSNNWPTWQLKLTGLKIFEEKLTICNRAVLDENFWMPVDTD